MEETNPRNKDLVPLKSAGGGLFCLGRQPEIARNRLLRQLLRAIRD